MRTTTPEDAAASMSTNVVRWPRTKPVIYEPADNAISAADRTRRTYRADDDRRTPEQYATVEAINEGVDILKREGLRIERDRPHDSCNGNCNQGRACDCVPDVQDDSDFAEFDRRMPGLRSSLAMAAYLFAGTKAGRLVLAALLVALVATGVIVATGGAQ